MSGDFENRMRAMARHGSYEAFLRLDDRQRRSFIESLTTPAEPGLLREVRARVEGLREHAQRQGTWGIEFGDDQFCDRVLAIIDRALSESGKGETPPPRAK